MNKFVPEVLVNYDSWEQIKKDIENKVFKNTPMFKTENYILSYKGGEKHYHDNFTHLKNLEKKITDINKKLFLEYRYVSSFSDSDILKNIIKNWNIVYFNRDSGCCLLLKKGRYGKEITRKIFNKMNSDYNIYLNFITKNPQIIKNIITNAFAYFLINTTEKESPFYITDIFSIFANQEEKNHFLYLYLQYQKDLDTYIIIEKIRKVGLDIFPVFLLDILPEHYEDLWEINDKYNDNVIYFLFTTKKFQVIKKMLELKYVSLNRDICENIAKGELIMEFNNGIFHLNKKSQGKPSSDKVAFLSFLESYLTK